MPWIKDVCIDAVCGTCLGVCQGVFGMSLFTSEELEEVNNLKNLAVSVIEKSTPIVSDPAVCEGIRSGKKYALDIFRKNASQKWLRLELLAQLNWYVTNHLNNDLQMF